MDLKERISKVIGYSALSLSEFADEIDVQRSSISHITSGRNKPSIDFLIKINNRFPDLEWEWLIEGEGEMLKIIEIPADVIDSTKKTSPTSIPDLFSLINDEAFGITESEDRIESKVSQESNISDPVVEKMKISDSQRLALPQISLEPESVDKEEVKVKRIVLFYENGKFETFEP